MTATSQSVATSIGMMTTLLKIVARLQVLPLYGSTLLIDGTTTGLSEDVRLCRAPAYSPHGIELDTGTRRLCAFA
jgi:hypothetical protein